MRIAKVYEDNEVKYRSYFFTDEELRMIYMALEQRGDIVSGIKKPTISHNEYYRLADEIRKEHSERITEKGA